MSSIPTPWPLFIGLYFSFIPNRCLGGAVEVLKLGASAKNGCTSTIERLHLIYFLHAAAVHDILSGKCGSIKIKSSSAFYEYF